MDRALQLIGPNSATEISRQGLRIDFQSGGFLSFRGLEGSTDHALSVISDDVTIDHYAMSDGRASDVERWRAIAAKRPK